MRARRALVGLLCLAALAATAHAERMTREYKLDVDPGIFSAADPTVGIERIGRLVQQAAAEAGVDGVPVAGRRGVRQVRYYDVPGQCLLREAGWTLRERRHGKKGELTLKLRLADRARVLATPLSARGKARAHLEEDVTPPATVWLSRSVTVARGAATPLRTLEEARAVFDALGGLPAQAALEPVRGDDIVQTDIPMGVLHGASLKMTSGITLWQPHDAAPLMAAEFSFRIVLPAAPDDAGVAAADRFYWALQARLPRSAFAQDSTKTAFVYSAGGKDFCAPR
ncbi:MAG: hypothetical protein QM639_18980 [Rhodocyclaceae bacterium]